MRCKYVENGKIRIFAEKEDLLSGFHDSTYKKFYEQPQYAKVLSNLDQMIKNKRIQTSNTKPITKTQAIQSMQRVEA